MAKAATKAATQKKAAKEKKVAAVKEAKAEKAPKLFNSTDPEAKKLFLHHLPKIKTARDAVATATANLRNAYKAAKADSYEKADFDTAFELETAEKEAKARAKIARKLVIAQFVGADLGAQLELFNEPVRTPAADRAFAEGETAAMKNEVAKPVYAPETEQYRRYMAGYHSVQEKQVTKGIKPLHPEVEEDQKVTKAQAAKIKKQQEKDAAEFDEEPAPTSGTKMSRSEFEAAQRTSHFQKN